MKVAEHSGEGTKEVWCKEGERLERSFVDNIVPRYGIDIRINPDKEHNPYTHDLVWGQSGRGDLKYVQTPFFTAGKYGYDPNETVTLNKKSYDSYRRDYPDFAKDYNDFFIAFYVDWGADTQYNVHVDRKEGLWIYEMLDIRDQIKTGAPLHAYKQRVDGKGGHAKDSYLIRLEDRYKWTVI